MFDAAATEPLLGAWCAWTATAPDAVTSSVGLLTYPDLPRLPPPLRGRSVVVLRIAFEGSAAEGEELVAPLRAAGPLLADDLRLLPYAGSGSIHREPPDPHPDAATNALLREFGAPVLRALLGAAGRDAVIDIRHLGGALRDPGPAAVGHRDAAYLVRAITPPGDGAGAAPGHADIREALRPWTIGHQLSFLYGAGAAADAAQTRAGHRPETHRRRVRLKAEHDPANRFRATRAVLAVPCPAFAEPDSLLSW